MPWAGRAEDKSDASVFAVTCVFTRAGYRRMERSAMRHRAAERLSHIPDYAPAALHPGYDGRTRQG